MRLGALLGLAGYLLLGASLVGGMLVARRTAGVWGRTHESLSLLGLAAGAWHGLDSLPPGHSALLAFTLPLPVSAGSLALAPAILSALSFYLRRRLRATAWRWVHRAAFPAFALATWHGLAAGGDTWLPAVRGLYAACLGAVALAALARAGAALAGRRNRRAAG